MKQNQLVMRSVNREELNQLDDERLMDAYCTGEIKAFEILFERFHKPLFFYIQRFVSEHKAADIVQTAFLKIHAKRELYRSGASVKGWFYTIARNTALDYLRSAAHRREFASDFLDFTPESKSRDTLLSASLNEALSKLKNEDREILYLHIQEGFTYKEIARTLSMKETAIRVRAHRLLKGLKTELGKVGAEWNFQ